MPYVDVLTPELPFQSGSDTSREAAVKARDFVGPQGEQVLAWFRSRGVDGGTMKEAEKEIPMQRASVCARVSALEKRGDLMKTTERRNKCAVYRTEEDR